MGTVVEGINLSAIGVAGIGSNMEKEEPRVVGYAVV